MVNSNFKFISDGWPQIYEEAKEAERLTFNSPKACAIFCRSALEMTVNWLYANDADLEQPYDTRLSSLIHEKCFQDIIKPSHFREINLIRKFGNNAAHGNPIKSQESLIALQNLYRFLAFVAIYYSEDEPTLNPFDEKLIPSGSAIKEKEAELRRLDEEIRRKQAKLKADQDALLAATVSNEELRKTLKQQEETVRSRRIERDQKLQTEEVTPLLLSESKTRLLFIDQSLKESGWKNLKEDYNLEYEVKGMPNSTNPSGIGFADYVLWGDDGLPIAVIEAKKTMADAAKGKHQAKLYADCLEQMHGQRPIIFYTNGFETFVWDDEFYVPRQVAGFWTKEELKRAIYRRNNRQDLRSFNVNLHITNRPYQLEAVQRIAERFVGTDTDGNLVGLHRKALLVMATGSGKTRTVISIVDMLTKCNWASRILFLADRNALVTQAKNSFNDNLPNLSAIDLTKEKDNNTSRLVFSTYKTIMNKIDADVYEGERFFGPSHFDLIIVDEAHRSVYKKYGAIFNYFDSLLVGLTATPKKELHRDTYGLFDIEDDNPTANYELDQAVADKYLVPPKAFSIPLKFPREGIKYSDLSIEEKAEYEEKFGDPTVGEGPQEIGNTALNRWLFNTDTVDKMLHYLMTNGIKVEGGDKLGKTIIFAKNHQHAIFIEERFNKKYPQYKGEFLRVIDNYESKAQDLLEKFCDDKKEQDPQIAVSVDMMDTGLDAPRVVNLVFFKLVKSYTKYWQMIGRGTRLRPNLFGPSMDKTHFLIFDLCGNIEFFEANPQGAEETNTKSLTQRIFEYKLELALLIRNSTESDQEQDELAEKHIHSLFNEIKSLDRNRFEVQSELRYVIKYSDEKAWENIAFSDEVEIRNNLSKLIIPQPNDHELARRFDVLMLLLSINTVNEKEYGQYLGKLDQIAKQLLKKRNIPLVAAKEKVLNQIIGEEFQKKYTLSSIENIRQEIRDLMRFLDTSNQEIVYTHFEDEIDNDKVKESPIIEYGKQAQPYKDRVETYLRKNKNHIVINKIRTNEPITAKELEQLESFLFDGEERGSKEDFIKVYGEQPLGGFVRSILGMELNAANQAFSEFLNSGTLSANQITFVNKIISFLSQNGRIEPSMLFEPPFTDQSDQGLLGIFEDSDAHKLIHILEQVDQNALGA